jgi:uncharacterized membrane protein YkvA (DUF1232 family)
METKEKKAKNKHESVKNKMNKWVHKSPKLEKLVDTTSYYFKHPDKFSDKVNEIYNQATGKGETTMTEVGHKLKAIFRMIKMTINGEYTDVPKVKVFLWSLALIYIITPIDLFSDFLPSLGFADEAAMLIWLVKSTHDEVEKFEQWETKFGATT